MSQAEDRGKPTPGPATRTHDVVVVGAGIAGALVAQRLARAGLDVLVVEAGERPYFALDSGADEREELLERFYAAPVKSTNSAFPNLPYAPSTDETILEDYYVQGGPDAFQSTYLRMVGGTTYHWLGTSLRYNPNTFREHTAYGVASDWPLSYDQLEDYYWRAETELGVSGDPDAALAAPRRPDHPFPMPPILPTYNDRLVMAATAGLTFDGLPVEVVTTPQARNSIPYQDRPPCAGSANCIPLCPIQAKYDASVHLKMAWNPALDHGAPPGARAAEALLGAVLAKVLVSDGQVSGLLVKRPDRSEQVVRGRVYVLAMNAIETAKTLLASAAEGVPNGVANSSDVVGRYLMDHDVVITYATLPQPAYLFRGPLSTAGVESLRDGPFRSHRAAFRIELQNTGTSWATNSPFANVVDLVDAGLTGERLRRQLAWDVSRQIELNGLIEPHPDPDNTVRPSATLVDELGIPRPELRYRVGEYSRLGAAAFVEAATAIYRRLDATGVTVQPGWQGAGHLMGTLRMGSDPGSSCCDSFGRSHDHSNLFLTGSGLFPTVDAANPTLTIAALALRTAEHIAATLRQTTEATP